MNAIAFELNDALPDIQGIEKETHKRRRADMVCRPIISPFVQTVSEDILPTGFGRLRSMLADKRLLMADSKSAFERAVQSAENAEKERSGPCGVGAGAALLLGLYPTLRRRSMLDMPA